MVVRKERSVRKYRGSHTHGWGAKKKHRGSGSRGGHGFAGSLGHKRIMVEKEHPGHIGKHGFTIPVKARRTTRTINVGDLGRLASRSRDNTLNLTEFGYDKLLSKGSVDGAVNVVVKRLTPRAREKIEKAGGSVNA